MADTNATVVARVARLDAWADGMGLRVARDGFLVHPVPNEAAETTGLREEYLTLRRRIDLCQVGGEAADAEVDAFLAAHAS